MTTVLRKKAKVNSSPLPEKALKLRLVRVLSHEEISLSKKRSRAFLKTATDTIGGGNSADLSVGAFFLIYSLSAREAVPPQTPKKPAGSAAHGGEQPRRSCMYYTEFLLFCKAFLSREEKRSACHAVRGTAADSTRCLPRNMTDFVPHGENQCPDH